MNSNGASSPAASSSNGERGTRRAEDDRRLFERCHRDGDRAAREVLIERHLPLARRLARRYGSAGEPLEDLAQVAALGLVKAIDRFDPTRATAFSSFAVPTILGELKREFRDRRWAVRVPRNLQELALSVERVAGDLAGQLGRAPTAAEIGDAVGVTTEQVVEAREAAAAYRAASLDEPYGDGHRLGDAFGVEEPGYRRAEAAATIERLTRGLSDRDREILHLRFAEDLTQSEIGERVGISQMHVSRLIRQAIAHLREVAEATAPERA